ncbi:mechanosensitive ion channel family protein [Sandaracinus amylolyticus]|uniref:mechanosensitive ion channel family protein n=1 Tax=Sandaracinus amylolyticus TaxID=927083 RepID=UPI001F1F6B94|nr:mechanosensitive ion channel family protein [Sandaracinus amylolyticus]
MPETTRLHELLAVTAFGGIGIVLAVAMLLAAYVLLTREERARLRLPTALLAMHVLMVSVEWLLPEDPMVRRPMRVLAIGLLLLSMARSAFLLVVHALVGRRGNAPLPKIIQDILQGVFYAAAGVVVLRAAGVEPTSLLTTSALLTAVIGLSLQETLGNLFAGLAIQAQRPFEIGDWIQLDANDASVGRVVEINWRATKLLTIDNVEITVPNGALARASLRNYSRPLPHVRRAVTITVAPDVPPAEVHRLFEEAVKGSPGVLEQPAPDVVTIGFTDIGVDYRVRFWVTDLERLQPIEGGVRDRLWYALQRAGRGIPGARREVMVQQETRESRAEQQAQHARDRATALHVVDFFRDVPADAMEQLAASTARRMYAPGETVIVEGSEGSELFVVETGEVEIVITKDRNQARVATLGPGRFFGEMSLMTGERRRATVRTLSQTVLLVVGKKDLQPILEAHPTIAQRISEVLAERDLALGHVHAKDAKEHKSIVEQRSDALLHRIRAFFSL